MRMVMDSLRGVLFGLVMGLLLAGVVLLLARPSTGQAVQLQPPATPIASATPVPVRVHVTGAIFQPGVYELPQRSTVQMAINAAGGPTGEADLRLINLAAPVVDGGQIIVPQIGAAQPMPDAVEGQVIPPGSLIDINTATTAQLETLPGIGPALAQRIVDDRTQNGPFARIEDIIRVAGIGEGIFENIKDLITISTP